MHEPKPRKAKRPRPAPQVIGWREWVRLPALGEVPVKSKIDTGARTSALHAFDLQILDGPNGQVAWFEHHPIQRSSRSAIRVQEHIDPAVSTALPLPPRNSPTRSPNGARSILTKCPIWSQKAAAQ